MSELFRRALDEAFRLCTIADAAQFGPLSASLRFADDASRAAWMGSFVPALPGAASFDVAIAPPRSAALDAIVPPDDGSTLLASDSDTIVAVWNPPPNGVLFVFDRQARRGLLYVPSGHAPAWQRSRPIMPIIQAALAGTSWSPVHAAAVGRDGRFLVTTGKGGAGKTTAALVCAAAGWQYAGDDFILVNAQTGEIAPLYTTGRLRADAPAPLDQLARQASIEFSNEDGDPKYELRLADLWAGRIRGGRVAAWLVPQRRGAAEPVFSRTGALTVFAGLFATAVQVQIGRKEVAAGIMRMIALAPAFVVDTGTDPSHIPAAFDRFIAELLA